MTTEDPIKLSAPRFEPLVRIASARTPSQLSPFQESKPQHSFSGRIANLDAGVWATLSPIDLLGDYKSEILRGAIYLWGQGHWDVDRSPSLRELMDACWKSTSENTDPPHWVQHIYRWWFYRWWSAPAHWRNKHTPSWKMLHRRSRVGAIYRPRRTNQHLALSPLFLKGLELQLRMWEWATATLERRRMLESCGALSGLWANPATSPLPGLWRTYRLLQARGKIGTYTEHLLRPTITSIELELLQGGLCLPFLWVSGSAWGVKYLEGAGQVFDRHRLEIFPTAPCLVEEFWLPFRGPGWVPSPPQHTP